MFEYGKDIPLEEASRFERNSAIPSKSLLNASEPFSFIYGKEIPMTDASK